MSFTVKYSLLKYRHSYLLGEVVNEGLLFIVPALKQVRFFFPKSLNRLSGLYNNFEAYQLRQHLISFHKKAGILSRNWHIGFDEGIDFNVQEFITREFLLPDAIFYILLK